MRAHIQGEHRVKLKAETRVRYLQAQECKRLPANHQMLGKGVDQILFLSSQKEPTLCLDLGLLPSRTEISFCCLSHPVCVPRYSSPCLQTSMASSPPCPHNSRDSSSSSKRWLHQSAVTCCFVCFQASLSDLIQFHRTKCQLPLLNSRLTLPLGFTFHHPTSPLGCADISDLP